MRAYLLLLVLTLASAAVAAPVPPTKPLTDADLVGTWSQTWGEVYAGPVTFAADGTFLFVSDVGLPTRWAGRWWVENGTLVLVECRVSETGGSPQRYEIGLGRCPAGLVGKVAGSGSEFRLSNPRR